MVILFSSNSNIFCVVFGHRKLFPSNSINLVIVFECYIRFIYIKNVMKFVGVTVKRNDYYF